MPIKTRQIIVGTVLIFLLGLFVFYNPPTSTKQQGRTLKITTSFYPLEFIAKTIGGMAVTVTNLTPSGTEPHDFEPSTRDIAKLESQDIILLNGGGLEGYADKIRANIDPKKTALYFVGESFMTDSKDVHVWVDPVLYKREAETVASILIQKDPAHRLLYSSHLKQLVSELDLLDRDFTEGLSSCKQRSIITSHSAFSYLAKRYSLSQIAISGLSPEEEPSAQTLVNITKFAHANKIGYIFFEQLVSPATAETLAREVGAKTLVLNPIEGLTKKDEIMGKTYLSFQRENLTNLKIALQCK